MTDPDAWPAAQHAFTAAHLARAGAPRRRVKVLWWSEATSRGPDVGGLVSRLWSGPRPRQDRVVFVAMFEPDAPVGTPPFLVVRAGDSDLVAPSGRATATVHGDAVPGGALVIEARVGTVVPVEPPAEPGEGAPPWTEVDRPA